MIQIIKKFILPLANFKKLFISLMNKILIVISINKSPFSKINKNWLITYFILLILGIIASIIIRLDFAYNFLNNYPYEIMVSIRLTSALYSILLIFLLIISIKYSIEFFKIYFISPIKNNLSSRDNSILFLYIFYMLYFIFISLFLININYYSIDSLNIKEINLFYIILTIISIVYGIYFSIYKIKPEINLSKNLSYIGKLFLTTFLIFYISLYIGIRTGIILDFLNKFEFIKIIHCEGTGNSRSSLNNQLRGGEDGNVINSNNDRSFTGLTSTGSNNTISNITISQPIDNNNTPTMSTTRTVSTTETIISPINSTTQSNSNINSNNPMVDNINNNETPPRYGNNNNLSVYDKGKTKLVEAVGIFTDSNSPLRSASPINSKEFIFNESEKVNNNTEIILYKGLKSLEIDRKNIDIDEFKENRELIIQDKNYINWDIKLNKNKYPGVIVYKFNQYLTQNKYSFILINRLFEMEKPPIYLSELLKNSSKVREFVNLSGLVFNDNGIFTLGSLKIIDPNLIDKIIPGYWSDKNLNRIEGVGWDYIQKIFIRFSKSELDINDWDNYKNQGKIRIGKINKLNIWTMNPLDENKWVLDWKNKNIQYLCNSGNIIQIDLPKNRNITISDFYNLCNDLIRFKFDYLIPGDNSSSKSHLLELLSVQYDSTIDNYINDLINTNNYKNYHDFIKYLSKLLIDELISDNYYDKYTSKIEKKIIKDIFPNGWGGEFTIPNNTRQCLLRINMPICYKGKTELPVIVNGDREVLYFETDDFKKIIYLTKKDYKYYNGDNSLKTKILIEARKYQNNNYNDILLNKLREIFK